MISVTAPPRDLGGSTPGTFRLFHGLYPGQPIDPHTLGRRLKAIGVPPQLARRASLMDIASELPAVVISRLLGFHQSTGDNWTRESQGFCADYAADISRR